MFKQKKRARIKRKQREERKKRSKFAQPNLSFLVSPLIPRYDLCIRPLFAHSS